jgi:hypothetical protein
MSDRLNDATAWWLSNPPVSDQFRGRVEKHGLYVALDMTVGFDWRSHESEFPPKAALRCVA